MSDQPLQAVAITHMDSVFMRGVDVRPGKLQEAFSLQIDEQRSIEELAAMAAAFFADSGRTIIPLVDITGVGESLALALQVKGFDVRRFRPAAICEPPFEQERFLNLQAKGGHLYNQGVQAGCITYVDGSAPPYLPLGLNEQGQHRMTVNNGENRLSAMLGLYWHAQR